MSIELIAALATPVITGVFALLLATYKSKKRIDELEKTLHIKVEQRASATINDMADELLSEFKADIEELKRENAELRQQLREANDKIKSLSEEIEMYRKVVQTMESELSTLRMAVKFYEQELKTRKNRLEERD